MTRSFVVGTAGHIDHGKSALVLALTGTDPDRLKEEKARGITIDLGFAHQIFDGINFAFVDVPGHERFVKNMLAGVGGIDLVVLVVAADESVMPQTREHFDICRLLRVPVGVVALTKSDLVDSDTLGIVRLDVQELVAGSFLENAPVIAVSARTGEGLSALKSTLVDLSRRAASRAEGGVTRLPIDRVFSMKGFGTVVTGTLVSGTIAVDQTLSVLPGDRSLKVRGVQVHGEKQIAAVAGQRSALNLSGVDVEDLARGQSLVTAGAFESTRIVDATIELLPSAKPLKHGARVRLHQGTAEILCRVALIGPLPARGADRRDGEAFAIPSGERAFARVRLETPAVLVRGDRFVLRAYSPPATIAGGTVLDPQPPRGAIRTSAALDRCSRLMFDPAGDLIDAALRAMQVVINDAGPAGVPIGTLTSRLGIDPREIAARLRDLDQSSAAIRAGDVLVAPAIFTRLKDSILATLASHHATAPLAGGLPREDLRDQVSRHGHVAIFDRALAELSAEGKVSLRDRVALTTHRIELSPDEERAVATIEQVFRTRGLQPPDSSSVGIEAGVSGPIAERLVKLLLRQKVLVRVDTLIFHDQALQELKRSVAATKAAGGTARIDVAGFKERFGVTRKFAIPLLEYLDRERVTRRVGESRLVL
ncbi:MAG TPA: selenocysteine-specific translation elongation factor [Vicinamibacterales bacterium]|jgi:selenocysteine-specific elongation factor